MNQRSPGHYLFGEYRRQVLGLMFMQSEQSFYVRQVADLCGLPVGSVHRELNAAWKAGVLTRRASGRQVYFQANDQSPIFEELKSIIRKTAGLADQLRGVLEPLMARVKLAFIHGSMASGRDRPDSDVDLLLVGDVTLTEVVKATSGAQALLGREINPAVLSEVALEAGIQSGDRFLNDVLGKEKIWIKGTDNDLEELGKDRSA